jgi:hypothetical protein
MGAVLAIVAVAVAVVLFVVLRDDDSEESEPPATVATTTDTGANGVSGGNGGGGGQGAGSGGNQQPPPKPEVPTIVVRGGEPVGGVQDLSFSQGDDIRFRVESDQAGEIHFHGYDVSMDVSAGGSVAFNVPAEIEGVFEVEVEETHTHIAEITVNPS